jgi:glycosyltransferase involved in cell wall biosynthesis
MPTYFGPTNLPPLEAWMWGKPLIYSANLGEQVGDAARCVNPDNADELAEAMYSCTKPEIRQQLVEQGGLKLKVIASQREEAENILLSRLYQFEKRRSCWH